MKTNTTDQTRALRQVLRLHDSAGLAALKSAATHYQLAAQISRQLQAEKRVRK